MSVLPTLRPECCRQPIQAELNALPWAPTMPSLRVQIVRFVEGYQPGIVECRFRDADGQKHSIIDKMPCFTAANLWFDSEYPQPGQVDCRLLVQPVDGTVRITLGEETTDGRSEVVVPEADLII